jgi:hypothetical protein
MVQKSPWQVRISTGNAPHILLVNPWIHDFAAYDVWAKPLGLLAIAGLLRSRGYRVTYIDCLDRFHPRAPATDPHARCGRGPYLKTPLPKPAGLDDIPRTYSRYGIKKSWFRRDIRSLDTPPDLILVTSLMTYWYPGVRETIRELRNCWPAVPVVLGGIYATLCTAHARRHCGADEVVTGGETDTILSAVERYVGIAPSPTDGEGEEGPAFDLLPSPYYLPLQTATGCPFTCRYCASRLLAPRYRQRPCEKIVREIDRWHRQFGVIDFVLYDDAFLVDFDHHAGPLLEEILRRGLRLRFHTPNALHIRNLTADAARLLFKAGFVTIRLGLESTAFSAGRRLDDKVTGEEFQQASRALLQAGFDRSSLGAYLLAGLPGQTRDELEASIQTVRDSGLSPILAWYTPIPGTSLWEAAVQSSRYDLAADPVFTNNAVLPCSKEPFSWKTISRLKNLCHKGDG